MAGLIVISGDFDEPLADKKLEELQVEIEQKIGKNSLLFQKIEIFLKHLVSINNVSGYHDEISQIVQNKKLKVFKNTMGGLVTQFQKDYDLKAEDEHNEDDHNDVDELSKVHFSYQFRIQDITLYEDLIKVREERNNLIHHFLSIWDMNNIDQCKNAIEYLNQQYRLAKSVMNQLIAHGKMIDESRKQILDVMIAEFIKESIIKKLVDINKQKNRNGWTSLTFAEQCLSQDIPREHINKLNYTYNCRDLRSFMIKTNVFDIYDEQTTKGNKTTYRIKLDVNLDNLYVLMPELVVDTELY